MKVSIIIPVLDEVSTVGTLLESLQPLRRDGHEIIVVDGGSVDGTAEVCAGKMVDKIFHSAPGRALQMNLGARKSCGELYWFLHADTRLLQVPADYMAELQSAGDRGWGWFPVRLSSRKLIFRLVGALMNRRTKLSAIATGDQGIFVSKNLFDQVGGFQHIPLMEDVRLCAALKKLGQPVAGSVYLETSSRRWEKKGALRTIFLMWYLRLAHFLGADPAILARKYYP